MGDRVTLSYATVLALKDICDKLLYEEYPDGAKKERPISFGLKYKINKNYALLNKDVKDFEDLKLQLLAIYGDPTEDGQDIIVKDLKKVKPFIQAMNNLLLQEVTHLLFKIEEDDLKCLFRGKIDIPYHELSLFQAYMCDEPELVKQLSTNVQFKLELPVIEEGEQSNE